MRNVISDMLTTLTAPQVCKTLRSFTFVDQIVGEFRLDSG